MRMEHDDDVIYIQATKLMAQIEKEQPIMFSLFKNTLRENVRENRVKSQKCGTCLQI